MKERIEDYFKGGYLAFYEKYLPSVKLVGGDEYKAVCPFHDDTDPSFNFNNEKGTYFCQGCAKKGHIAHFYAKLKGLDTRRDFPKILKGIANDFGIAPKERKFKVVKTYDYVDSLGALLFQVCRMEPKDFRQRKPDGNGKWIWNLKDVQTVLYRLPEILTHSEIIVVEGERDADALASLGFCSTTCPMGAKKWKDHYNETLKGKHVVLIPDNDVEGREHMAQVGTALRDVAASLKLVELPDLPSKGDVSDWLAKIGDRETAAERLSIMIENASNYAPRKQASIEDAILAADTLATIKLPEKKLIMDPWLFEQSISLVPGWRGVGKTWFGMGLVDAITRGEPFGPWPTTNSIPCLYVEAEMAQQDVQERIRDLNPKQERKSPLYVYSDAYANHLGLPQASLLKDNWRDTIKRIVTAWHIKLLVLDNIASLAPGIDENKKMDWDPINRWLIELRFAGIATILIHHVGKEGQQRGTSSREDNIDTSLKLIQPSSYTPEDGCKFVVRFEKSRAVRTANLSRIQDYLFHLTTDNGQLIWTWGTVKGENTREVLKLLDKGHSNKDIAAEVKITSGRVSQIKKQGLEDGHLSKKDKLTQSGMVFVYGDL